MPTQRFVLLLLFAFFGSWSAQAHEFWLDPNAYRLAPKQDVQVQIQIGENFEGSPYPYLSDRFFKFVAIQEGTTSDVEGLDGDDDPAVSLSFPTNGLGILAYHAKHIDLTFETFKKFEDYLGKIGQEHRLAQHVSAGKPNVNIEERYYRAAKLLLDIGDGNSGEDLLTGMPLELVVERNPYALPEGEELPIRLYFEGKPISGVLVKAFSQQDPKSVIRLRTDTEGRVRIGLPTKGPWLINAVHMFEPSPDDGVDWISIWASTIFERR